MSGASFSAARPIDLMPPMITSHVSTRDRDAGDDARNAAATVFTTSAIEFGCVNGVVVSAATPATSAYIHARTGDPRPSRR